MNDAEALLRDAREGASEPLGRLLQLYRNYLTILAATQLDRRLRRRLSPSDLVQETMLAAHRDFAKFQGSTEPQFLAWLRKILINCLYHSIETHVKSKMRDVRCEVSIDEVTARLDRSSMGLADRGTSPSGPVREREQAVAFANELAKLRPQYREVIVLRNLQGLSFEEIAARLNRNGSAVRMLWLRAIEKLRQVYEKSN
jgi:RNA polymerase sigma-70 factor (ECF subfamily)